MNRKAPVHGGEINKLGLQLPITEVNEDYTLTLHDFTVKVDASTGDKIANLPTVEEAKGFIFCIKKIDNTVNKVTITPANGQVEFSPTKVLTQQGDSVFIQSDGANWFIL